MAKQGFALRIEKDVLDAAKTKAQEKGMSVNAYFESLIKKDTGNVRVQHEAKGNSLRISLSDKEMERLNEKASELDMTPTQFIRDCINRKSMTKVDIVTEDLDELLDSMYVLTKHLNGLLNPIQRSGAFQQDVDRILNLHSELNDKVNKIYMEQMSMREQIYSETKRMVLEAVKEEKHIRRRRTKNECTEG